MEKRGSLKVKNKKIVIVALFLLAVLVGCSQKNAEEMTIGEGSFHPDKNDEIVLEGSVSPKEIKYQVVDSNDKVILEGVTKNGLSDIKFKAPKKEDSFYTLKSGELEEEFYVYSVESENEIKEEVIKTENPSQYWQNGVELTTTSDWSNLSSKQKEQYLRLYFNEDELKYIEEDLGSINDIISRMDLVVEKNTDKSLDEINYVFFNTSWIKKKERKASDWNYLSNDTKNKFVEPIIDQYQNMNLTEEEVTQKIDQLVASNKLSTFQDVKNDLNNGIFKYGQKYIDSNTSEKEYTQQINSAFGTIDKLKKENGQ